MHGRELRAVSLAAVLALLTTGAALASGQGADTVTQQFRNVPLFSISTVNPCTGASGTFTATAATEVFHETVLTPGVQGSVTVTAQGVATFTPDDPQGVSASGHFVVWAVSPATARMTSCTTRTHSNLTVLTVRMPSCAWPAT